MARHDSPLRATLAGALDRLRRSDHDRLRLADHERLDGRTALITGGNRGLGLAIAELLAGRGARLILACRSGGPEAAAALQAKTGNPAIEAVHVDLSERASIRALVDALAGERLDRVILNAAVVPSESRTTSAGLDWMFQVNFLAAVDLSEQLLERGLIQSTVDGQPARILFISSEAHRSGQPDPLDRLGAPETYSTAGVMGVYGRNKLYLTSYAWALAADLDPQAIGVFALGPGAVATDIAREAPRWMRFLLDPAMKLLFQAPLVAAEPAAWLCCAAELDGQTQRYFHMHAAKQPAAWASDAANAKAVRVAARALLERV